MELVPTEDIVAGVVAARRADQTVVGFAAEHGEGAVERGRAKLARKGLDAVVVNDISRSDIGFDSADNEVTIVLADGERAVGRRPKAEVAAVILDEVERFRTAAAAPTTVEREP
jgi:phosphopantothenoylcysteine decarboxylase/phosphopantothenate--cysteine ligase